MSAPDSLLEEYLAKSDIKLASPIHDAISDMLCDHDLNVAVWYFETKSNSHAARANEDASYETCPALHIFFKYESDVSNESIDVHIGNWDDKWNKTASIRKEMNAIFIQAGLDSEFVSDRTFIFTGNSWENRVLDHLGRIHKDEFSIIASEVLPKAPEHVFWNSSQTYHLVFKNKKVCEMAKAHKKDLEILAERILSHADPEKVCLCHKVRISFMHRGMKNLNLHGLSRQD